MTDEDLEKQIRNVIDTPTVDVAVTQGKALLSGTVTSDDEAMRLTELAKTIIPEVSAVLDITDPAQVRVEVRIVEITTQDLDQLGFSYPTVYDVGETAVNSSIVRQTPVTVNVDALVQENKARMLSRPSTTVLSGKEAKFNVGGEVPIPRRDDTAATSQTTVEFREFGIQLEVTPTVDRLGNVTMELMTEVSEPDFGIGVEISGGLVPGFRTRTSETEVFVKNGETLVMAGLIDTEVRRSVQKFPLLGDLPILGALFRSTDYQEGKTELVILVTPHTL